MAAIKAWKHGDAGAPSFPEDFEIVVKAVLQVTDIKSNHNKYYAIELHSAQHKGQTTYRVFTHYGRTDDLETNPDAGQKECRYFDNLGASFDYVDPGVRRAGVTLKQQYIDAMALNSTIPAVV